MTPKEKALELCQNFGLLGMKWEQTNFYTLALENAKECAIIMVDELIACLPSVNGMPPNLQDVSKYTMEYWIQVKQEIQKL